MRPRSLGCVSVARGFTALIWLSAFTAHYSSDDFEVGIVVSLRAIASILDLRPFSQASISIARGFPVCRPNRSVCS